MQDGAQALDLLNLTVVNRDPRWLPLRLQDNILKSRDMRLEFPAFSRRSWSETNWRSGQHRRNWNDINYQLYGMKTGGRYEPPKNDAVHVGCQMVVVDESKP
jgi:hypothetical protein